MEGIKCSGCKWFNCLNVNSDNYGFCRSTRNIGLDADCYEPEERSIAVPKIDYIRQEINGYINSKTKEEIDLEVNEIESVFDQLNKYLENATQEELDADWEKLKKYNEVGPDVVDFVEQNAYKAGHDAAMKEFKEFLLECQEQSELGELGNVYHLIQEKLEELEK